MDNDDERNQPQYKVDVCMDGCSNFVNRISKHGAQHALNQSLYRSPMKTSISNELLYSEIKDMRSEIRELIDKRISPLEMWRAEIMGKIAVFGAISIFGVNLLIDWIKEKVRGG